MCSSGSKEIFGAECVYRWTMARIEYEGLQMVCFQCGHFGHNTEVCLTQWKVNGNTSADKGLNLDESKWGIPRECETSKFGPWMVAKKTYRKAPILKTKVGIQEQSLKQVRHAGSRFIMLEEEQNNMEVEELVPATVEPVSTVHESPKTWKKKEYGTNKDIL